MDVDILSTAEEILGRAVLVERHREWATFWCPFHNDADRAGQGGHPNFGVHLSKGYWKCLRCGASGGSLKSLSYKLGKGWQPPVSAVLPTHSERPPTQVERLDEALVEARATLQRSPAWGYLAQRGLRPYTSLVYGLGYGLPVPAVHKNVIEAASQSLMLRRDGTWMWAGSVVYADPPTCPAVLNVRYIPEEQLLAGTRNFVPKKNHKSWGRRVKPLGAWRITGATRTVIVREAENIPALLSSLDVPERNRMFASKIDIAKVPDGLESKSKFLVDSIDGRSIIAKKLGGSSMAEQSK